MTTDTSFRERLLPGTGALAAAVGAGVLALVVLLPVHPLAAVVVGAAIALTGVVWLVLGAPVLAVHGGELHAGHAHVPTGLLGEATVLSTRGAMREELSGRLDARAHVVLRSWIATGVRVALDDPADPTPYWLMSTRRPEELVAALDMAKAATPEG